MADERLVTTEQCDFDPSNCADDTQRNWRDLIKDNPFEANQSAQEFPPRESLMMLAAAPVDNSAPTMDSEGFCVFGDEIDDSELTRSDRFA